MRIRNWSKFQHFKDRRPPWVKLYRDILDDIEWHRLDGDSAKHLVMLWLLASEGADGELPPIEEIAFRLRITEKQAKTTVSRLSHWVIQDDNSAISPRYQSDRPETETETETEGEKETEARKRAVFVKPTVEQVAEYCRKRGNSINSAEFMDHYTANGWMVGKSKMKDWQASVRTWERRQHEKPNGASRGTVRIEDTLANLRRIAGDETGGPGLDSPHGDVRGAVFDGVFERTQ
jgi:hypothetical protein